MTVTEPGSEMQALTREECLELPADEEVGRTDPGTKLAAASYERVAFEVDCIDHRRSWSVLVQGVGQSVTPDFRRLFERVRALAITPWAPGDKEHWVRVLPGEITGRRLVTSVPTAG